MNTKDLAKKIEYFDNFYRRGEAKISDAEHDSKYLPNVTQKYSYS